MVAADVYASQTQAKLMCLIDIPSQNISSQCNCFCVAALREFSALSAFQKGATVTCLFALITITILLINFTFLVQKLGVFQEFLCSLPPIFAISIELFYANGRIVSACLNPLSHNLAVL